MLAQAWRDLREYAHEMWGFRYFWLHLVKADLQKRYRRSAVGVGWSLLQPLCMALVLTAVYSRVMGVGFWQFGPALLAGLAFWSFIQQSCLHGCSCFLSAEAYMRQQPMPTLIFPLRVVLLAGFHFAMSLLLAAAFAWVGAGTVHVLGLLAALPVVVLLTLLCWSLATIAAYSHVYLPDTQHLLEVGLQMVFYMTPIIYPASLLEGNGFGWLLEANPLAHLVEMLRQPLLTGDIPAALSYLKATLVVLPPVALAMWLVRRLESDLIFAL
jgi:ABC-type polysaccharide/polyol phosphate export permease